MKKLFSIALSLLLSVSTCFAQQAGGGLPTDSFFVIDDFSKLLLSHKNPYNIGKEGAIDAYNVRANDQFGSLSKRTALNTLGTCGHSSAVTGLHRYYKSDATKYTVTSSSTFVDYISDSGSCTNLGGGYSSGRRWTFITYKNWEIGTNGYDAPIKWDGKLTTTSNTTGARTAGDLVTNLGAPFAELLTGTGLTASRWYQYRIAYYNGTTYSYSTARTNPLLLGSSVYSIKLTDIPLGPSGTTHRYIYRTTGQTTRANVIADTSFYLVTDISDNTTTTFSDNVADGTITADNPPTWATVTATGSNATPPHGIYAFIHKDYIWFADDPSGTSYGQSTVYFSQVLNPDYWLTGVNYFLVRPDDGDVITGITSFLGTFTVIKTNSISKIYTDVAATTSWQLSQPYSFIGAVAPYSIQTTPLGIFYLGRYGLYKFDGQSSSLISDVVTKDIRDINPTNYGNVSATYFSNEYRMAYEAISTGAGANDRVLLFDIVRNSFVKDTEAVNVWSIYNSSDDFGALYSGSSDTDGNILAHSTQPTSLVVRYLTDLTAGTFDGTYASGDNGDPTLSMGWTSTWATASGTWASQSTSTWQVQKSPATWIGPIVQINANALSKLYWNQILNAGGTATIAIRTATSAGGIPGASWSSEFNNPAGSDISGVTAHAFIQMRVTFTNSDFTTTPYLYVQDNYLIKLVYSQTGMVAETTVPSSWNTGWIDLVSGSNQASFSNYPKTVKEIDIYYDVAQGATGTMSFNFQNLKGTNSLTFNIDLSIQQLTNPNYWGSGTSHMYRWLSPGNGQTLVGDKFMISMSEPGISSWKIQRIVFRSDVNNYVPYRIN